MKKRSQHKPASAPQHSGTPLAELPYSTEEEIQRIADYVSAAVVGKGVPVAALGADFQFAAGMGGFPEEPAYQDFLAAVGTGDWDAVRRILGDAGVEPADIEGFVSSRAELAHQDHTDSGSGATSGS